jgi:predicted MFS family arabinose efflux permease
MQIYKHSDYRSILTLAVGFSLLNLDRWVIAPLFPVIMQDLGFNYQDLGIVVGITALTWGVASLVLGGMSDRIGRRKILIPTLAALSIFSGITGLAGGLGSMVLLRGVLGIFEGAYVPTAFAAVKDASAPQRVGLNMGMLGAGSAIATEIAHILATQLLPLVPSWHWVFVVVSIPGLIVTYFLYQFIQDPQYQQPEKPSQFQFKALFKYRNIRVGILSMCGIMAGIFVLSAMIPTYLTDHLKLSMSEMGYVASSIGFGGFVGAILIPGLSDRVGRKPALIGALVLAAVAIFAFKGMISPGFLFATLFLASGCIIGSLVMLDGPIATETVPAPMIGAASGIIIGIGEIFGGGVAPVISGVVAENFGIEQIVYVALGGVLFAAVCAFFLVETAAEKQN